MKYNDLINELLDLLDKNQDIKNIKVLKEELLKDKSFQEKMDMYHLTKTVNNKQKLLENHLYLKYLKCESNINFLIQDIKNNFNVFNTRKCHNESN